MDLNYEDASLPLSDILQMAEELRPEIQNMLNARLKGYDDDRASINLPDDEVTVCQVRQMIQKTSLLNPKYIILIGIGGSNLGTMAVQEAVLGQLNNQLNPERRILYADTVDSDLLGAIINIVRPALMNRDTVLLNVISKSGTTTETIANFTILSDLLKKYQKEYHKSIVVTSDRGSKLWNFALQRGFEVLEIPRKVGGRYSIFSSVGLFPLGLLGLDITNLLKGARIMRDTCVSLDVGNNPAAIAAAIQYLHYLRGRNISDLFLFSKDLESLGKWYRQLMAESLGKEFNRKGERVTLGLTPTVSIGSTDLHSMAQLYLGGPYDKLTTFVKIQNLKSQLPVPTLEDHSPLVSGIQGRNLQEIMDSILEGAKLAFKKGGRPFVEITLPDKSETSIGEFMQFEMMKTIYLGSLLGVNPYDQPNVESYKIETRRILA